MPYIPAIHTFNCDICHESKSYDSNFHETNFCLHCNAKLCYDCNKYGFCPTGFKNLPSAIQNEIIQSEELRNAQLRQSNKKWIVFVILGFILLAIDITIGWDSRNQPELYQYIYASISIASVSLVILSGFKLSNQKGVDRLLQDDRIKILLSLGTPAQLVKQGYILPKSSFLFQQKDVKDVNSHKKRNRIQKSYMNQDLNN